MRLAKAAAARVNGEEIAEAAEGHGHSHDHGHDHGHSHGGAEPVASAAADMPMSPRTLSRAMSVMIGGIPNSLADYKLVKVIGRGSHSKVRHEVK